MARQVLPIVGAVIGAAFMMPQVGYIIGPITGDTIDPTGDSDEYLECVGERDEGADRR